MLADWVFDMAKIGYSRSTEELRYTVKRMLDSDGRPNPFVDNLPGYGWLQAFLRHHPQIAIRQSDSLLTSTLDVLNRWFDDFEVFLKENVLTNRADQIWNADESGFPLHYCAGKVLAMRGAKCMYSLNNPGKQQITTLVCVNATGQAIPPMYIFPGERFHFEPLKDGIYGSYLGRSASGWMDSALFYGWLTCHFIKHIPPMRPVL